MMLLRHKAMFYTFIMGSLLLLSIAVMAQTPVEVISRPVTVSITYPINNSTVEAISRSATTAIKVAQTPFQLQFTTQPSTTFAGAVMTPPVTVALADANGITISNAVNTVTLSALPAGGGATISLGAVKAVSGTATFSTIQFTNVGSYTLQATATGFTNATSNPFSVILPTVTPSAGANGTISPSTAQTVNYGSSLTFTATPGTGYTVNTWSLDGTVVQTGGTTYTLANITANHTVNVTFILQTFILTPSAGANGTISPSTAQTVNYGGSQTFTATPGTGYKVNSWSLDGTVVQTGGTTYTLANITANHTVSVTFIILTFAVTPSAGANGSISPSTVQTVNYGSSLTLTATPGTGYTEAEWSLDGTGVQAGGTTYTLTNITANHTVSVTFKLLTYTITPSAGPHGAISPSTVQTVNYGSSLTFTAAPNTGYAVDSWALDGTVVQYNGTTYTLTNITANHTVVVNYFQLTYAITPSAGTNGAITPSTTQQVNYGSSLTFSATPSTGYAVNTWALDGTVVATGVTTYTLANITANHTVAVTFTPITLSAVLLTVNPESPQATNTAITLTATPTDNGGQVQYLFRVGYTDAAGWHWTNINGTYTTTASCTWTPTTTGTFTLIVWAREVGQTVNYQVYASLLYMIYPPPITAVALAAKPASPQPVNTPIKLTATPTGGGGQVQYLFRVGYADAAGWHWSNINGTYTTTATCTWTPTVVGSYTLVVWARLIGNTDNYDQYTSQGYQVTVPPLTAVALAAKPATPQPENTTITLTATPTGGGGQVQYLFRVGYADAAGWHWSNINGTYTTTATCSWTPAAVESYTLVVWARLVGHTANYDVYTSQGYQVTVPPLTAVALAAKPASPQPENTAITLTATPTGGGGQVQYLFRVGYSDAAGWHWSNINSTYTTTASCTWTPAAVESYTLVVWARLIGHTANYDAYTSQGYQVTVPPLTAVALKATPATPQPVNSVIKLTATPTGGGGQVQYLFRVGYTNATGWIWTNLNSSYTTTATCTWTPTAVGTYTLVVWARVIGHTATYDQYATQVYQVTVAPLTAVALSATPTSPQQVNTTITLAATPTGGGGQVQYLFRVGYQGATGWQWTNLNNGNYTTTATCSWTPATAGTYSLVVWARLVGDPANYDQYQAIPYQITAVP